MSKCLMEKGVAVQKEYHLLCKKFEEEVEVLVFGERKPQNCPLCGGKVKEYSISDE